MVDITNYKSGQPVWATMGGHGFRKAEVATTNKKEAFLVFVDDKRNTKGKGKRTADHLFRRDPALKGEDKPFPFCGIERSLMSDYSFVDAGKSYVEVPLAEDWQKGDRVLRVTINDVAKYFAQEARSMSGCHTLAGETGDWRPIDNIAQACLEFFKQVNIEGMRTAGRKFGLEPKF